MLFKDLATLRTDIADRCVRRKPGVARSDARSFGRSSEYLGVPELADQAEELAWER